MHKYFFLYTCLLLSKRGQLTRSWLMTRPSSEHSTPNQEQGLILPSSQFLRAPYGSESTASLNFNRAAPAIQQRTPKRELKQRLSKTKDPPKQAIQTNKPSTFVIERCAQLKPHQEPEQETRRWDSPPTSPHAWEQLCKNTTLRSTENPLDFLDERVGPPRLGAEDSIFPPPLRWIQQE